MRFSLIFSLIVFAQLAFGQTIFIKDDFSFKPLENVNIYSLDKHHAAVTNPKGQADITQFQNSDSILFQHIGYESVIFSYKDLKEFNFHILLNSDIFNLRTHTVAATRWNNTDISTPHQLKRLSTKQLELKNPQTTADFLGTSNLVFIQKSQLGGGSPMIRGFSANRLLIAVDGVRMNNAIYRSGNLQNIIAIDPFSIETTDIILGPGSVIYGSDALGGVMNFGTKKPKLSKKEEAFFMGSGLVRYGSSNQEKTTHFDIHYGRKKWGILSSFTYSDFGALTMGANGPDEYLRTQYVGQINGKDTLINNSDPEKQIGTSYSQFNFLQKIRFKPNAKWDINYGFHFSQSSTIPRYDRLIQPKGDGLKNAEWYYGPQKWMMHNLNILHHSHNKIYDNAQVTLAYQNYEESRNSRKFDDEWLSHRAEEVDIFSANVDLKKKISNPHILYYGAEVISNLVSSNAQAYSWLTDSVSPLSTRYPDGSTWNSYGFYLSHNYHPNTKLTLHTGARYTYIQMRSTFDTSFFPFPYTEANLETGALNGSFGILYEANIKTQFSANISTGFRAPNIDDMAKVFDSEPGFVVVPNPDLKSEYAYNIDFGFKRMFFSKVKIDMGVFYTYLNNALIRRDFQLNGKDSIVYDGEMSRVQAIQNASNAYVYGAYFMLDYELTDNLKLNTAINYQKGEEEDGEGQLVALRHAAPTFGSTRLSYSNKKLSVDLYSNYSGAILNENLAPSEQSKDYIYAIDADGNPYSPSWYTLNLKGIYEVNDFLLFSLGVENITNQRYRTYSSGIVAPGVHFIGMVKIRF